VKLATIVSKNMNTSELKSLMIKTLLELATPEGINASSRKEIYGCLFGRDGAISSLQIMRACAKEPNPELMSLVKRTLESLIKLQGIEFNPESGEEPGKFIHEYRREGYEHLVAGDSPWYLYPDKTIRNYDSIDSTALVLIAIYRYWEITGDLDFLKLSLPAVERGLMWMKNYGDIDGDGLLEFMIPTGRQHGGLTVHSWTDSTESFLQTNGKLPPYPIAAVEVQGLAWLAYKIWADYFNIENKALGEVLEPLAEQIKKIFNQQFLIEDAKGLYFAQGLDGDKQQIKTITANPLLTLWSAYADATRAESIVSDEYIAPMVKRAFLPDIFDERAGMRTMSTLSTTYNSCADSYHNGSFWPMLNGLIHEGLLNFGFHDEAAKLREATLNPILHFETPIELYICGADGDYQEYLSPTGNKGCREQAWSAAALLSMLSSVSTAE
jgi:glycogen debranching enzyme